MYANAAAATPGTARGAGELEEELFAFSFFAGLLEVGAAVVEAVGGGSLGTTRRRAIAQIATTGPDTKKTARQPEEARTPAAIALATTPPKFSQLLQMPMTVPRSC